MADEDLDIPAIAQAVLDELAARASSREEGADPIWLPSIEIARSFGIRPSGSKDSRKRGARYVTAYIDETWPGRIMRSFHGIALAQSAEDMRADQEFRRKQGLSQVIAASKAARSDAQADADGQIRLF